MKKTENSILSDKNNELPKLRKNYNKLEAEFLSYLN